MPMKSLALKPRETPPSTTMFSTCGSQDEPLDLDKILKFTSPKKSPWDGNSWPESNLDPLEASLSADYQLHRWAYETIGEMTFSERLEKSKWEAACLERW